MVIVEKKKRSIPNVPDSKLKNNKVINSNHQFQINSTVTVTGKKGAAKRKSINTPDQRPAKITRGGNVFTVTLLKHNNSTPTTKLPIGIKKEVLHSGVQNGTNNSTPNTKLPIVIKKEVHNSGVKNETSNSTPTGKLRKEIKEVLETTADQLINKKKVFVIGFGKGSSITKDEVQEMFSKCGKIKSIVIPVSKDNRSKGFAFISFDNRTSTDNAIKMYNNTEYRGKTIYVKYSNDQNYTKRKGYAKRKEQSNGGRSSVSE